MSKVLLVSIIFIIFALVLNYIISGSKSLSFFKNDIFKKSFAISTLLVSLLLFVTYIKVMPMLIKIIMLILIGILIYYTYNMFFKKSN